MPLHKFPIPGNGAAVDLTDYTRIGLLDYNDLATQTTPLSVVGGAAAISLPNDELGAFTNKAYSLPEVSDVWDAAAGAFDWSDLALGDMVDIRLDIEVTTTTSNQDVDVALELGVGGGLYQVPFFADLHFKLAGTYKLNIFNGIYMGDSNTHDNGGVFKISSDANATVQVNGWYCKVIKRS